MIFLGLNHRQQHIIEQHRQVPVETFRRIHLALTEETLELAVGNDPCGCPQRGTHLGVHAVFTSGLPTTHHENGQTIYFIKFKFAHGTAQVLVFRLRLHFNLLSIIFYL